MNKLYIDCSTGIAGDMLTSALLDLLDNEQQQNFLKITNNLLANTKTTYRRIHKFDMDGSTIDVIVDKNQEEFSEDVHEKKLSSLTIPQDSLDEKQPNQVIKNFDISKESKKRVIDIFELLMDTESFVHHTPKKHDIHFNKIGSIDALIDITNICLLLEMLDIETIAASSVNTGYGQVKYNQKVFSVPAPATKKILEDIPNFHSDIYGELCTPTGVAVLKKITSEYMNWNYSKNNIKKIGIGFGQKEFNKPTFVKCILY